MSMTFPLLLQFLSTTYKWVQMEEKRNKRWSWIPLVLQFWPQWRALGIMKLDWKNDSKTEEKKRELKREVLSNEPFLEAFPSMLILQIIVTLAGSDTRFRAYCSDNPEDEECQMNKMGWIENAPEYCEKFPEDNQCAVFEGFGGMIPLGISIWTSITTVSFGIIKFLQIGPYSVLSDKGLCFGMLKWRFVIAFITVFSTIIFKLSFVSLLFGLVVCSILTDDFFDSYVHKNHISILLSYGLLIIPNLMYSIISITTSTGMNNKLVKLVIRYPASLVLPLCTFFVIGPQKLSCCSQEHEVSHHLGLSKHLTILNIIFTLISYLIIVLVFVTNFSLEDVINEMKPNQPYGFPVVTTIWVFTTISTICAILFNIIFLSLDENWCFSGSQKCLCLCCCGPDCYKHNDRVLDVSYELFEIVNIDDLAVNNY